MSLIYGEYLVNVHFSDIHIVIPHFNLHSAEKNPYRIFRKLPLTTFRIQQNNLSPVARPVGRWNFQRVSDFRTL